MRITNMSGIMACCIINNEIYYMKDNDYIDIDKIDSLHISHEYETYNCFPENNTLLKFLSLIDDPFKLKKEYHIAVDIIFENLNEFQNIVITHQVINANIAINTYYDVFVVRAENNIIKPFKAKVSNTNKHIEDFEKNYKKLHKWDAFWNIFIDPFIYELVGIIVLCFIFLIYLRIYAIILSIGIAMLLVIINAIIFIITKKADGVSQYKALLDENNVLMVYDELI